MTLGSGANGALGHGNFKDMEKVCHFANVWAA